MEASRGWYHQRNQGQNQDSEIGLVCPASELCPLQHSGSEVLVLDSEQNHNHVSPMETRRDVHQQNFGFFSGNQSFHFHHGGATLVTLPAPMGGT